MAVKNRTPQCNQIHGFLLEYGVESPRRVDVLLRRLHELLADADNELPSAERVLLRDLGTELRRLHQRVLAFDAQLAAVARDLPTCQRLRAIPGVGVLTATPLVAAVGDAEGFRNGRQMAAWPGLVPRQRSTGGRPTLLGISKRGDAYLHTLPIHGARSSTWRRSRSPTRTPGPPEPYWPAGQCSTPSTGVPRERGPGGAPPARPLNGTCALQQVARSEMKVMANRSDQHVRSLVNVKVFETARLLTRACAEPISGREPRRSQREAGYMSATDLPATRKLHPLQCGAGHICH